MTSQTAFSADALKLDLPRAAEEITAAIRSTVQQLHRRGAVVGLSGGIDSSVCAALCVRALGAQRVLALSMPEPDSSSDSGRLAQLVAGQLGIKLLLEDVGPILRAAGCYRRRDEAIRSVIPEFAEGWKCKISLPDLVDQDVYPIYSVVVESPQGERKQARLTTAAFLGAVAATSFKQRVRAMMEYYHADRLQYAVVGTPNRLEYDQGFFVKHGDGAADLKPIAHLYKTQVYQLAEFLGIPEEIQRRPPTTDTYSLAQSQEEFYFALPLAQFDLCLYGKNHGLAAAEVARALGMTAEQVERVFRQIESRRRATRYLHTRAVLVQEVSEVRA